MRVEGDIYNNDLHGGKLLDPNGDSHAWSLRNNLAIVKVTLIPAKSSHAAEYPNIGVLECRRQVQGLSKSPGGEQ